MARSPPRCSSSSSRCQASRHRTRWPARCAGPANSRSFSCDDVSGSALVADAGEQLTKVLNSELDGQAAKHADEVEAKTVDLETTDVATDVFDAQGRPVQQSTRQIATHLADLDRDTRKIIGSVQEGAGKDYYRYRVDKASDEADTLSIRTEVAALFSVDGVLDALDAAATTWVRDRLSDHAVAIQEHDRRYPRCV